MKRPASSDHDAVVLAGYERLAASGSYRNSSAGDGTRLEWLGRALRSMADGQILDIVELGCGDGARVARTVVAAGHRYVGVDISPGQIDMARSAAPGGSFVVADMRSFDRERHSVDVVVALYSLYHVDREAHAELLARWARWLRPGGRLLLSIGVDAWEGVDSFVDGVPMWWSQFDAATTIGFVQDAGLVIDEATEVAKVFNGKVERHVWLLASLPPRRRRARRGR